MIFHDLYLEHPRLGRKAIPELMLSEVREVRLTDGSDIPTLRCLVEHLDGHEVPLIPELKKPEVGRALGLDPIPSLCRRLEELQLTEKAVIQCFNARALEEFRACEPRLSLLALYRHDQKVDLEQVPGDAEYLGVPMLSVFFYGAVLARKVLELGKKLVPWRELAVSENRELLLRLSEFRVHAVMVDDAERALMHYGRLPVPQDLEGFEWELMCQERATEGRRCRPPAGFPGS